MSSSLNPISSNKPPSSENATESVILKIDFAVGTSSSSQETQRSAWRKFWIPFTYTKVWSSTGFTHWTVEPDLDAGKEVVTVTSPFTKGDIVAAVGHLRTLCFSTARISPAVKAAKPTTVWFRSPPMIPSPEVLTTVFFSNSSFKHLSAPNRLKVLIEADSPDVADDAEWKKFWDTLSGTLPWKKSGFTEICHRGNNEV